MGRITPALPRSVLLMVALREDAPYHVHPSTPEWRNWYTHQTQNLARFTPRVGSSPTSGTNSFANEPTNVTAIDRLLRQTSAGRALLDAGTSMARSIPVPRLKIRPFLCARN